MWELLLFKHKIVKVVQTLNRSLSFSQSFDLENKESTDSSEERPASSIAHCDNDSFESVEPSQSRRGSKTTESPTIIIASRPHSSEVPAYVEDHVETVTQSIENDDDNGHRVSNNCRRL